MKYGGAITFILLFIGTLETRAQVIDINFVPGYVQQQKLSADSLVITLHQKSKKKKKKSVKYVKQKVLPGLKF